MSKLPVDVQQEFMDRKRQAQLDRILLPDAPPRKRRTQRPSPERGAIEFISTSNAPAGQVVSVSVDFIIIAPEATDVAGGEVVGTTDEFYMVPSPEPAASVVAAPAPVVAAPAGDYDSDILSFMSSHP
ncbi:uncharacterized protein LOC126376898 [Pectinophora gossypiella]|uniref:uncharacterized protein LOC126376898 n=1 Tax=Pectinophora gossypiella TaxID=13191 RepID=UPI00214E8394|nr:uncharacterized protein LOC126376898 [Pectinophora gossypiella]